MRNVLVGMTHPSTGTPRFWMWQSCGNYAGAMLVLGISLLSRMGFITCERAPSAPATAEMIVVMDDCRRRWQHTDRVEPRVAWERPVPDTALHTAIVQV